MSPNTTGQQPQTTHENNAHANASEEQTLTPDRPPQSVEEARTTPTRRPRGFAAMDRTLVSDIARKGGKAAHTAGTAHEFTTEEAREAGRKGGRATHAKRLKATEDRPVAQVTQAEGTGGE
jgi:general stress protein YciG